MPRQRYRDLPPLEKLKADCRSYTNLLLRRGKLSREPCLCCGNEKSQAHHPDYTDPRNVLWLCRPCHQSLHQPQPLDSHQ